MVDLTEQQWEELFNGVDETISKTIDDLPLEVQKEAEKIECIVDKYQFPIDRWKDMKVLGCYLAWTNGPIAIFAGQIFEDCNQNMEATMASVRQIYLHELAHAIGNLEEYEVKERGL